MSFQTPFCEGLAWKGWGWSLMELHVPSTVPRAGEAAGHELGETPDFREPAVQQEG